MRQHGVSPTGRISRIAVPVSAALALMGCGGGDAPPAEDGEAAVTTPGPAAVIVSPADGDTVPGGEARIVLEARGVTITPAGLDEPGAAHHHLFLDRDITAPGETIPTEPGIVHLGNAQTEHVFTDLAPGPHTIVAVLGDFQHVRPPEARTDTVRLVVP